MYEIYTDGSFTDDVKEKTGSGIYIPVLKEGISAYTTIPNVVEMRNVGGELSAILLALHVAGQLKKDLGEDIEIIYDYSGCGNWVLGTWKAKKAATQKYIKMVDYYKSLYNLNVIWTHIKGHTGIEGNNQADTFAKNGVTKIDSLNVNKVWEGTL